MREIFAEQEWNDLARAFRLSPREVEVAKGIFDDQTEAAIALELGVAAGTVHTYVERLYMKTSSCSRLSFALCLVRAVRGDVSSGWPTLRGGHAEDEDEQTTA